MRHPKTLITLVVFLSLGATALGLYVFKIGPFATSENGSPEVKPSPTSQDSSSNGNDSSNTPEELEPEEPPPPQPLPWGPTDEQFAKAQEIAGDLSAEELAGQLLIAHWSGTDPATAAELTADYHLAGVILMGANIETAAQVTAVSDAVQNQQEEAGRSWPAIICVDQEGGRVARLRSIIEAVPSFADLAEAGNSAVAQTMESMAAEMADLGFTMDFAPVADVSIGSQDPTIGDRAAGQEPRAVAQAVQSAVDGLLAGGVIPTLKHFPGHGSVTTDSHKELPVQKRDLSELREKDFVPFASAVDQGAPVVMMGHIALQEFDADTPATLSPPAYELLRAELDFGGVIVTDAMNMEAITKNAALGQETVGALAAGADLVLMPPDTAAAHEAVVAALESGELARESLEESAARVIALQMWFDDGLPN